MRKSEARHFQGHESLGDAVSCQRHTQKGMGAAILNCCDARRKLVPLKSLGRSR